MISEPLLLGKPLHLNSGGVDVAITVDGVIAVEVTVVAIPLLDEVEELGLEGAHRRRVELFTFSEIEVKADLELERFLIHQHRLYRNR